MPSGMGKKKRVQHIQILGTALLQALNLVHDPFKDFIEKIRSLSYWDSETQ